MTSLANRRSVMTLYADPADPTGHAVRIVLAEKEINVEVCFVTEETKPEDLHDLNPYHTILTLVDRELVLYDAQIMLEYLDERYPHPPLMPMDPALRANNRQLRYRVTRDLLSLAYAFRRVGPPAEAARADALYHRLKLCHQRAKAASAALATAGAKRRLGADGDGAEYRALVEQGVTLLATYRPFFVADELDADERAAAVLAGAAER